MPFHIIGNRILSDEEFKEEERSKWKWLLPTIGWLGVLVSINFLFDDWAEANAWYPVPLLFLAWFRAGLFEIFGMITVFGFLTFFLVGALSGAA